mmetsp:Transcript_50776/g.95196  ORF Transcript_50776/g.95196 Transcript_50776/m.95196 type:complete len:230 (+) Transcript_50776:723-1412(+)
MAQLFSFIRLFIPFIFYLLFLVCDIHDPAEQPLLLLFRSSELPLNLIALAIKLGDAFSVLLQLRALVLQLVKQLGHRCVSCVAVAWCRRYRSNHAGKTVGNGHIMRPQQLLEHGQPRPGLCQRMVTLLEQQLQLLSRSLMVHLDNVLDLLGSLSETQGAQSFLLVEVGWRARDDQGSFGIASERFLQHAGELRVAIWHVCILLVSECIDDVAQGGERPVYILRLIQSLS